MENINKIGGKLNISLPFFNVCVKMVKIECKRRCLMDIAVDIEKELAGVQVSYIQRELQRMRELPSLATYAYARVCEKYEGQLDTVSDICEKLLIYKSFYTESLEMLVEGIEEDGCFEYVDICVDETTDENLPFD